ncbi:MAG: hypothetical protein Q8O07_06550 [Chloroflexota bacterium]|nr:hypothetical protein [Chloroflexota bacterium]
MVVAAWPRRAWRSLFVNSAIIGGCVVVLAGWWYIRNQSLYGDPLGWQVWTTITGLRQTSPGLLDLLAEFQGFRISYWGLFGGVNVLADTPVYAALDVLSLAALAGLLVTLLRSLRRGAESDWATWSLLILWVLVLLVGVIRGTQQMAVSQGRFLFPAIAVISLLMVMGLVALVPRRLSRAVAATASLAMFVWAVSIPFRYIAPAYAQPAVLTSISEAAVPNPVHIRYGGVMELLGFDLDRRVVAPGDEPTLRLYWRSLAPMDRDYSIYIHARAADGRLLGQRDSYPGGGARPTSQWRPGDILIDSYRIPITSAVTSSTMAYLDVGLYTLPDFALLPALDPQGNTVTPVTARFRVRPPAPAVAAGSPLYTVGQSLALDSWQAPAQVIAGQPITVSLSWRCIRTVDRDYTVFVQVLDFQNQVIAQTDGQPQGGGLPTSFWEQGENVVDVKVVRTPPALGAGQYRLVIGMYDLASGQRLPTRNGAGAETGDSITLGTIVVN